MAEHNAYDLLSRESRLHRWGGNGSHRLQPSYSQALDPSSVRRQDDLSSFTARMAHLSIDNLQMEGMQPPQFSPSSQYHVNPQNMQMQMGYAGMSQMGPANIESSHPYQQNHPYYYGQSTSEIQHQHASMPPYQHQHHHVPHQEATTYLQTPQVLQYTTSTLHMGRFNPNGSSSDCCQFMNQDVKRDLYERQIIIASKADPEMYPNLPDQVEYLVDLVPLEALPFPPFEPIATTTTYKVSSTKDGRVYAMRQICNFPVLTVTKPKYMAENWLKIRHSNICAMRDVFISFAFGIRSCMFIYDFLPKAISLEQMYFTKSYSHLDAATGLRISNPTRHPGPITEFVMWSYIMQISSAIHTVHGAGLAVRTINLKKILVYAQNKIMLTCCGIQDVLFSDLKNSQDYQAQDLVDFGKVILCLGTGKYVVDKSSSGDLALFSRNYSSDLAALVATLLASDKVNGTTIQDIMEMIGIRIYAHTEVIQSRYDVLENEFSKELENGRLFRLLCKLNCVIDHPQGDIRDWGEHDPRLELKLFHDYVFHQVTEEGKPWLDMNHIVQTLNKLDAGVNQNIRLASPEGDHLLIMSYKDLKNHLFRAFEKLQRAAE